MMASDTPRTDALYFPFGTDNSAMLVPSTIMSIEHARELERALAKYENAELPEEPPHAFNLSGNSVVLRANYDALRTYAAAQTVRADEAINSSLDKIMAMTDEQIRALSAFDGHNPDDEAKIGKYLTDIAILKHKLDEASDETIEECAKIVRGRCSKCSGAGWLRGSELDNADEATQADTMTKYSCDGELCKAADAICALKSKS